MALVANEGFDLYNGTGAGTGLGAKWIVGSTAPGLVAGRFGGQGLNLGAASSAQRNFTAGRATGSLGMAVKVTTQANFGGPWGFRQGATPQFYIRFNTSGGIDVNRTSAGNSAGTTIGSTASSLILLNAWYYVEVCWTISTTVGIVNIYLDGSQVLNLTGTNNSNAGGGVVDNFYFDNSANGGGGLVIDDMNEGDSITPIGPLRVETIRPASDSSVIWTPNSGVTNYSRVNETLSDGDTTYVQATNVGNRDLYTFASLSSSPAFIPGVQMTTFADKTDAGLRQLANSVRSGSTDSDGPNFTLGSTYGKFDRMMQNDPNTSAAWTAAGVAALLGGPKLTT